MRGGDLTREEARLHQKLDYVAYTEKYQRPSTLHGKSPFARFIVCDAATSLRLNWARVAK